MIGWLGRWRDDFARSSASCRLKSMMKRAAWSTLSEVKASGFWASTSATSAVDAEPGGRITRPSSKSDGTDAGAQSGVPPIPVATDRTGDEPDQSGATGMGELLRGWTLQRVLQLHQRLGREEGQAPSGACPEAEGLRLGTVE